MATKHLRIWSHFRQANTTQGGAPSHMAISEEGIKELTKAVKKARKAAEKFGYDPVCVIPQPKAGGSFATAAWKHMADPVAVEHVRAHAGLDIGCTMIGMHLREVAVPLRLSVKKVGEAAVNAARTRPKLIGGARAVYPEKV